MADVEALDAVRAFGQAERFAQRHQARLLCGAIAHALRDCELRVLACHVEPYAPLAMGWGHCIKAFHRVARDYEPGQRLLEVMLLEERRHYLSWRGAFRVGR